MSENQEGGNQGATGGTDWVGALEPDMRSYVQTKGYKTPADVVKAYIHAEKAIGMDKVALPPKGQDGNRDWSAWDGWKHLGRPDSHEGYKIAPPDGKQFTDQDKAFHAAMLPAFHKAGLAQWQVDILRGEFEGFSGKAVESMTAAQKAAQEKTQSELKAKWGVKYDENIGHADKAIAAMGLPDDFLQNIAAGGHGMNALEKLAEIGSKYFAEDGQLPGGKQGGGTMTPADAQKEIKAMEAAAMEANVKGASHPGWDKKHPEYRIWQDKRASLYQMAYPDGKEAA